MSIPNLENNIPYASSHRPIQPHRSTKNFNLNGVGIGMVISFIPLRETVFYGAMLYQWNKEVKNLTEEHRKKVHRHFKL